MKRQIFLNDTTCKTASSRPALYSLRQKSPGSFSHVDCRVIANAVVIEDVPPSVIVMGISVASVDRSQPPANTRSSADAAALPSTASHSSNSAFRRLQRQLAAKWSRDHRSRSGRTQCAVAQLTAIASMSTTSSSG